MDGDDISYVRKLVSTISYLARLDHATVDSLSANFKSLVIGYCRPKLRKNLSKGSELLVLLKDRNVLKETYKRKRHDITAEYNRRLKKKFDSAIQLEHGNNLDKYFDILVNKVNQYVHMLSLCAPERNPQRRTLWKATKLASILYRSTLFHVILEFIRTYNSTGTNLGGKDWVINVENHLKKAGMYHMAVQTLIGCTQKSEMRGYFANLQDPIFLPSVVNRVALHDWADVIISDEFGGNEESIKRVRAANLRLGGVTGDREGTVVLHAELNILRQLVNTNVDLKQPQPIGVSKQSCYLCYSFIKALRIKYNILVSGTHGKVYGAWSFPTFTTTNPVLSRARQTVKNNAYDLLVGFVVGDSEDVVEGDVQDSDLDSIDGFGEFSGAHIASEDDVSDVADDD
ncbi:hypothetical protein HK102_006704 [Quaeritorhiza haematococci]|nr:hypothetical protein HK102_006704 [Quaeritorhiza haematococci]